MRLISFVTSNFKFTTQMNIETLLEFFGWCTVINYGFLALGLVKLLAKGDWVAKFRAKLFGIDEESVRRIQFTVLMAYGVAIALFNLAPYIALRNMI
jgi:hypothetical protein